MTKSSKPVVRVPGESQESPRRVPCNSQHKTRGNITISVDLSVKTATLKLRDIKILPNLSRICENEIKKAIKKIDRQLFLQKFFLVVYDHYIEQYKTDKVLFDYMRRDIKLIRAQIRVEYLIPVTTQDISLEIRRLERVKERERNAKHKEKWDPDELTEHEKELLGVGP